MTCPVCGNELIKSCFDMTFRTPEDSERLFFGIPAKLCEDCHQLYIDPGLLELLDLGPESGARCTFAIESDELLRKRAMDGSS